MVLGDLEFQKVARPIRTAPVAERFLAFFFDVVLFTPIFTLLLSQLFKKIELRYYTSPDSIEFLILGLMALLGVGVLTVLFQTAFIYFLQGTPGKLVFKMRVVDYSTGKAPTVGAAFLRSTLWVIEFCFLAVPFLEVISQKQRRMLHDRASDTVVTTLKDVTDGGPHPLESHFVRNVIVIFVSLFCLWGALFASKVYLAAIRGDFKKQELENDQYLCSVISDAANPNYTRLDLAIALFVAQEIPEDCLLSEADFAFWTNNETELGWAYLAKGFYFKFDKEKSSVYLNKVCDIAENSSACDITQIILGDKELDKNSTAGMTLTGQVLHLRDILSHGQYLSFLKESRSLTEIRGFHDFIQQETVKALWGSSQKEQAQGAYLNSIPHLEATHQIDMASWMCLEEIEKNCAVKEYASCNDLKLRLKKNSMTGLTTDSVLALVKEKDCRKDVGFSLLFFHEFFQDNPLVRELVGAISSDSDWSTERRLKVLRQLSFSTEASRSVRHRAQLALAEMSHENEDVKKILSYLEQSDRKDWFWKKMSNKLVEVSQKNKWDQLANKAQSIQSGRLPASLHQDKE